MVRASGCEPDGWRFDPARLPHQNIVQLVERWFWEPEVGSPSLPILTKNETLLGQS